jgi:hypothetical protein
MHGLSVRIRTKIGQDEKRGLIQPRIARVGERIISRIKKAGGKESCLFLCIINSPGEILFRSEFPGIFKREISAAILTAKVVWARSKREGKYFFLIGTRKTKARKYPCRVVAIKFSLRRYGNEEFIVGFICRNLTVSEIKGILAESFSDNYFNFSILRGVKQ